MLEDALRAVLGVILGTKDTRDTAINTPLEEPSLEKNLHLPSPAQLPQRSTQIASPIITKLFSLIPVENTVS